MNEKVNLGNFFRMSKLEYQNLNIEDVLSVIETIKEVDTTEEVCYEKFWIKSKMREDNIIEDLEIQNFGKKEGNLFVLPKVLE